MFDKLQDKEIEEIVLGTILIDYKDSKINECLSRLTPEDFYNESLKIIFKSILDTYNEGKPVDIITITTSLKSKGKLEKVGGAYYISSLTNRVVSSVNFEQHIDILIDLSSRRGLIHLSGDAIRMSADIDNSVDSVCSFLNKGVENAFNKKSQEKEVSMADIIEETNENIEKASKFKGLVGTTTGRDSLDKIFGGRQAGKFYIKAARPSMGKSADAMNEVIAAGLKGEPVAFFNLEMDNVETMIRILAHLSGINSEKISKGRVDSDEWKRLFDAQTKILNAPIYLFDNIFKLNSIASKARKLVAEKGVKTIYVDYLQLIQHDAEKGKNREQEISAISRTLKLLSQELKIAVVALSQLSRAVEMRGGDKKPLLSDLRESGQIEMDADVVEFIYRPEYYGIMEDDEGMPTDGVAYILIRKHRGGSLGDIRLIFTKETSTLKEFDSFSGGGFEVQAPETNGDLKPLANFYEVEKEEDDFLDDNDNPF